MQSAKKLISTLLALLLLFALGVQAWAETLALPSELKAIEEEAFAGDSSLDEVSVPEGAVSIGSRAFAESSLAKIHLPFTLQSIADDAFEQSAPTVAATAGTYAYTWAVEHGLRLEGVVEGELSDTAKAALATKPAYAALTARRLTVDGIPLNEVYLDDGHSKPLVIFIHGGYGNKDTIFGQACEVAAKGFYCVAIDCAACGDSAIGPIDDVNSVSMTVSQIDAVISYYSTVTQADETHFGLWGNSMGGLVVFAYAVHGQYRPTMLLPLRSSPDFAGAIDKKAGPLYGVFDHGERREGESVLPVEEVESILRAYSPMNHPEAFEGLYIYAGNGTADTAFGPEGCMALKQYLDEAGGDRHVFLFYEGLTHDDPYPDFNPIAALRWVFRAYTEDAAALAFASLDSYTYVQERAAFSDDSEAGLYHESRIRDYALDNYDALTAIYEGNPEWSVEFVGDDQGASLSVQAGEEPGTVSVVIDNEPVSPCTLQYKLTCSWGKNTISGKGTLHYVEAALPALGDVAEEYHGLRVGETYTLPISVTPADYSFGKSREFRFNTYMDCDVWEEQNALCVRPKEMGAFPAGVGVSFGNIRLEQKTWLYVEGAKGVTEGTLTERAQQLLDSGPGYEALTAKRLTVNGIPLYEVYRDDGTVKPLAIMIHGGGGSKEGQFGNACNSAMAGLHAIAIDAAGCGDSNIGPIDAVNCWKLTVSQIDSLIEYYNANETVDAEHFGILGGSMGANISYAYVCYGKYKPVIITPAKGSPDYMDLGEGPRFDTFDHGRPGQPNVMSQEEILASLVAYSPIHHMEAFEDLYIFAGNGLNDTVTGPSGCQALKAYLDSVGGTKHIFNFYENCEHGEPMPGYDPIRALHNILIGEDEGEPPRPEQQ